MLSQPSARETDAVRPRDRRPQRTVIGRPSEAAGRWARAWPAAASHCGLRDHQWFSPNRELHTARIGAYVPRAAASSGSISYHVRHGGPQGSGSTANVPDGMSTGSQAPRRKGVNLSSAGHTPCSCSWRSP